MRPDGDQRARRRCGLSRRLIGDAGVEPLDCCHCSGPGTVPRCHDTQDPQTQYDIPSETASQVVVASVDVNAELDHIDVAISTELENKWAYLSKPR